MAGSCDGLRQIAAGLQECLVEGAPKEEKYLLLLKGLACIAEIKNHNQLLCEKTERMQSSTAEAKAQFDAAELSLQNLLYEKEHYTKEIRACQSFRSKFSEEDINLIPEEQFMSSAPEQLRDGCEDPHKLMLQRLEHEKQQRMEAIKAVEGERSRRDALVAKAAQQRANLTQLEEQLSAVRTIAEPLRVRLDIPPMKQHLDQLRLLEQLPQPLHTAFLQLRAAQEAFGLPADISIAGDTAEADAVRSADAGSEEGHESAPAGEADLEPGEQPLPKKRKLAGGAALAAEQEHPLSLIITIRAQPGRTVRLRWLRALHLVTAEVAGKAGLSALAKLFPDDDGLYIASDTAHAAAGGHLTWDAERLDRPYRWAQDLAGLQFLPPLDAAGRVTSAEDWAKRKMSQASAMLEKLCGSA